MKLSYFDLISPKGVIMSGIGRIKSPVLRESICVIGYQRYQYLLTVLLMTPRDFIGTMVNGNNKDAPNPYDDLSDEEKAQLNMFDILTADKSGIEDLGQAIGLFIDGTVQWDNASHCYLVNPVVENEKLMVDGTVNAANYPYLSEACLRLVSIEVEKPETLKFKNERSRKFYERFMKKKEEAKKMSKHDPNYELPNIISALATFHNSLNMSNIWDLTVYQVYDSFYRQQNKNQVFIHDQNYSVWGGEYKPSQWLERLDNNK